MSSKLYHKSSIWKRRPQNKPKSVITGQTFKGVSICASIRNDGRLMYLGSFATAEDAARAYDEAAVKIFGNEAITNESLGLFGETP